MVIEERKAYSISEMKSMFSSNSKENIDKKLRRYGIEYSTDGRGNNCIYTINKISDPFKVFCILELDFTAQTDFNKLRHFLYHFFNDEIFMSMPDKKKEEMMDSWEYHISRQTMAKYERKLIDKNYVYPFGECYYYFAYKTRFVFTDKETYCKAWNDYWNIYYSGISSWEARACIIEKYKGMPMKNMKKEFNAFTINKVNELNAIIKESIENELAIRSK